CAFCLFVIKKIESLLPTNVTEDALKKLMEEVCDLLPQSHKDQCDDFIAKYGTAIVEFLLSSAAPHTICALLHLCLFEEQTLPAHAGDPLPTPEPSPPSDCESCRTLAALSRLNNGPNATQPESSAFLRSVCSLYPNAVPKCDAFTKIYGPRLEKVLGNQLGGRHVCETAELCVPQQKMELLGKERCTWGPRYWCMDAQTAHRCGNLAFCQKFMWKDSNLHLTERV
uniref:Prosaposin n=1 Tax=Tetraodon nigroviridis TaxID=99883 RepID=H3DEI5_TETNG